MKVRTLFITAAAALAFVQSGCQTSSIEPAPVTEGDDIVGVVTGPQGPEAGVWVIAETDDLPTKFYKIVVTDDQGRFAIPSARHRAWSSCRRRLPGVRCGRKEE